MQPRSRSISFTGPKIDELLNEKHCCACLKEWWATAPVTTSYTTSNRCFAPVPASYKVVEDSFIGAITSLAGPLLPEDKCHLKPKPTLWAYNSKYQEQSPSPVFAACFVLVASLDEHRPVPPCYGALWG